MGTADGSRPHADPREVSRQVVPALTTIKEPGLRLLIMQMQPLVGRVNLCALSQVELTA